MEAQGPNPTNAHEEIVDVLVIGSGPAGLTIAAELAGRGKVTSLIAPEVGNLWATSYGAFLRDVAGTGVESAIRRVYERPLVHVDGHPSVSVKEPYARFDTTRLQSLLLEKAARAGVKLMSGCVIRVNHSPDGTLTACDARIDPGPGERRIESREVCLRAVLVIDASGGQLQVEGSARRRAPLFQTAFGYFAEVEKHPFGEGEMSLMDYRTEPLGESKSPRQSGTFDASTFLYAMSESGPAFGPGTVFVQETSLVSALRLPMSELRERLSIRLRRMNLSLDRVLGTERCVIPMGGGPPEETAPVLPFGASAGLVHPATGYQLALMLRLAPVVADAISATWSRGAHEVIQAGIATMWPQEKRKAWRLFELGAYALSELPQEQMQEFIFEFFSLSGGRAVRFMAGSMESHEILETMWRVFQNAPRRLRADLFRGSAAATSRMVAQKLL